MEGKANKDRMARQRARSLWASYIAMFRLGVYETLRDPVSIGTGFVIYAVLIVIFSSIFAIMPIEKFGDPALTVGHLAWYFVATEALILSNPSSNLFGRYIAQGRFVDAIQRPPHPALGFLCLAVGKHLAEFSLALPFGAAVLGLGYGVACPLPWSMALPCLGSFFLGIVLMQMLNFLFSSVEISGPYGQPFGWLLSKLIFTFGGLFLPVIYFPQVMREMALVTPFPSVIFAPAHFMLPAVAGDLWFGMLVQMAWIGVCSVVLLLVHRRLVHLLVTGGG